MSSKIEYPTSGRLLSSVSEEFIEFRSRLSYKNPGLPRSTATIYLDNLGFHYRKDTKNKEKELFRCSLYNVGGKSRQCTAWVHILKGDTKIIKTYGFPHSHPSPKFDPVGCSDWMEEQRTKRKQIRKPEQITKPKIPVLHRNDVNFKMAGILVPETGRMLPPNEFSAIMAPYGVKGSPEKVYYCCELGFIYAQNSERNGNLLLRCQHYSVKGSWRLCKAWVHVKSDDPKVVIKAFGFPHSHPSPINDPDSLAIWVEEKIRQELERKLRPNKAKIISKGYSKRKNREFFGNTKTTRKYLKIRRQKANESSESYSSARHVNHVDNVEQVPADVSINEEEEEYNKDNYLSAISVESDNFEMLQQLKRAQEVNAFLRSDFKITDGAGRSIEWNCLVPVTSGIRPLQLLVELSSNLDEHRIKLSCFDDVTFHLYTCSLNSENYANLAEMQSLHLQFFEFPDFFKSLLQNAVTEQNKYVMSLMTVSSSEDEGSEIELIVTRQSHDSSLVQVKKLSLLFQSATDEQIKQYLISKSKMDKRSREELILENKRLEKLLEQEKVKNKELQYGSLLSPSSSTNRLSIGQNVCKPNEPKIEQLITSTSHNVQSPSIGDRSSKSPVMNTPPTYCFRNEASIKVEPAEETIQALPVTTFSNEMNEGFNDSVFSNVAHVFKSDEETSASSSGAISVGAIASVPITAGARASGAIATGRFSGF